jgi:hypothetical protein
MMDENHRLLVVANETIAAHQLMEMIRRRAAQAPTHVLLVTQARARFDVPIVHVEVLEPAIAVTRMREAPDAQAPATERHEARDWLLFALAGVLAIGGTVMTALLVFTGMSDTALVWWVVFGDLGLKVVAFVLVWLVFQRRARADRLDY